MIIGNDQQVKQNILTTRSHIPTPSKSKSKCKSIHTTHHRQHSKYSSQDNYQIYHNINNNDDNNRIKNYRDKKKKMANTINGMNNKNINIKNEFRQWKSLVHPQVEYRYNNIITQIQMKHIPSIHHIAIIENQKAMEDQKSLLDKLQKIEKIIDDKIKKENIDGGFSKGQLGRDSRQKMEDNYMNKEKKSQQNINIIDYQAVKEKCDRQQRNRINKLDKSVQIQNLEIEKKSIIDSNKEEENNQEVIIPEYENKIVNLKQQNQSLKEQLFYLREALLRVFEKY